MLILYAGIGLERTPSPDADGVNGLIVAFIFLIVVGYVIAAINNKRL